MLDDGERDDGSVTHVSDLRDRPFVVLLGEPGMGKSTVLAAEATRENLAVVTVRELMTGAEIQQGTPLYLDALDEYRTDGGAEDKAHAFAHAILKHRPPRWRLTCRSEDWRKSADVAPIRKTTSGQPITVAQLLPLDTGEAVAILRSWGETDPEEFVRSAESFGATAFLENPLGLKLLRKAVADGGAWPANRFELFASAVRKLSYEHSDVRVVTERHDPDTILEAAAETCLVLLVAGARAVWRSNREPPALGDARAFLTWHELGMDRGLVDDVLDTALFRGEGESFEPMHKTVAEFLAAKALSAAVRGTRTRAARPLSRALALITAEDGTAPTELRGVYAWFAAHLARDGVHADAVRLIRKDAVSVLNYGDAAIFDTAGRRAILEKLGTSDPYFRGSDIGVTAVGGLAGEDLAADFAAVLKDASDDTHRRYRVFEALTVGPPVRSLAPLLRSIVLDPESQETYRLRALEALSNGCEDPGRLCRELFDALADEPASSAREAVRSQLAGGFAKGGLTVVDVRSVLADYCTCPPDNMLGRLRALQDRIETDPMPELFEIPLAEWMPERPDHDNQRDHRTEVGHTLDYALAAAIGTVPAPTSSSVWRWIANTRRGGLSRLKTQAAKAFKRWLEECAAREVEIFNEILARAEESDGPWVPTNKFRTVADRMPSCAVVDDLLRRIDETTTAEKAPLLAVVVEIVNNGAYPDAYWQAYDRVMRSEDEPLLERLTCRKIETWQLEDAARAARGRQEEERRRLDDVAYLAPLIADLEVGRETAALGWGAEHYFVREAPADVGHVAAKSDAAIADAIVRGWDAVALNGLGDIDAKRLGDLEARSKTNRIENAAVAGIYRRLIDADSSSAPRDFPLDVALAVLKSSWTANDNRRSDMLDRWAIERLDADPKVGAERLLLYWNAALDAGSTTLPSLWKFDSERRSPAFELALYEILRIRPDMNVEALRSALKVTPRALDKRRLADLASVALNDPKVDGACRELWLLVVYVLDPATHSAGAAADTIDVSSIVADQAKNDFIGSIAALPGVDRLPTRALMVSLLGRRARPERDRVRRRVMDVRRKSETVRNSIKLIAADPRSEAAAALARLLADPALEAWESELRHAQVQQLRIMRDGNFKHPSASAVRAAIDGGPPVNASDLRAIVASELHRLRSELRSTDTTPWKRYWNSANGKVTTPLIENECRDNLLDRLRDRLDKYRIAGVAPEARRGEGTRTDVLVFSGAGRNLPIEVKRHFHPDVWTAPETQLQGYASDPGADGLGIYLVFWFGNDVEPTPARPNGQRKPGSAAEMEAMLTAGLTSDLAARTNVIVFDVSDPNAKKTTKRRKRSDR
ncbi:hypothetical protein XI03_07770 [Bradyrhizobium sp. CCBAU 65884]|nr:hypothetical protein [Bradyrhizobium sp. CCBAU 65884]